jgi:hypothetical protein
MPLFMKFDQIKKFWQENEKKLIILLGFLLVSIISFEAGVLNGEKWQKEPLIIEKPASAGETINADQRPSEASKLATEGKNPENKVSTPSAECAFVGSKNSNKYHLPTCRWAKQIKPENLVCFKTVDEAVQRGYQPDKNCVK